MARFSSVLCLLAVVVLALAVETRQDEVVVVRRDDAYKSYAAARAIDESKASYLKAKPKKTGRYTFGSDLPPPGVKQSLNNYAFFAAWRDFKQTHNKSYNTYNEEQSRFNIYVNNQRMIDEHNKEYAAGRKTFRMQMNHYGDMTNTEFRRVVNGFKRSLMDRSNATRSASTFLVPNNVQIPESVDWRTQGYVTPVKDQGHCGSCWAFSAVGALEGQHFRKAGKLISLSEQNLVDCSAKYGNQGCNGGLMDNAFQYIKENHGIDTEDSYPYEAKDDRCRFKKDKIGADDTGFADVPQGDETALTAALATVGPVSVAIDASHESFQFYHDGVYQEPQCSPDALDHGVLAVGYGVSDKGEKFYIVKNSWGANWGESGYIRMKRDAANQCGIASAASYPLV